MPSTLLYSAKIIYMIVVCVVFWFDKPRRFALKCLGSLLIIYICFRVPDIYPTDIFPKKKISFALNNVEGFHTEIVGDYYFYTDKGRFINRNSSLHNKYNSDDVQAYVFKRHADGAKMKCEASVTGLEFMSHWPLSISPNVLDPRCV